jgi:hypothetical protein
VVRDNYLSKGSRPPGVQAVNAAGVVATSEETREISISAQTTYGRIQIVVHYHPSETGNFLHFKPQREGEDNQKVNWNHWLLQAAGVSKASFS